MENHKSYIPSSITDKLPTMVRAELANMPPDRQGMFIEEYRRKRKSTGLAYVLWFIIGLHYIYLGKFGLQFFFWITAGGFLIWWLIDLFRIPGMISNYNKDMAVDVLRDQKIISGQH